MDTTRKKIAVITPSNKIDRLERTVIDGFMQFKKDNSHLRFFALSNSNSRLLLSVKYLLSKKEFINFAHKADLVFLIRGKKKTDYEVAKEIGDWDKTIFIDGSEVGLNNRYDFTIQKKILAGKYREIGKINFKMLKKCALYFRREKPYINGIIPLPFGIESRYTKYYSPGQKKDIDFVCIFGQDEYPLMRRYVRELLVKYCKKNKFTYRVKKTKSPDEFYRILARTKVGISVGGGGYDTARFWEILGNNCLLLTERIDMQFNNLYDFWYQLHKIGEFLQNGYNQENLVKEYKDILSRHSSKARVLTIVDKARQKGILR